MRVLVGKTFGIGNAVLTIPLIKALNSLGHTVDLLIGTGPDDFGAKDVFLELQGNHPQLIGHIWLDDAPLNILYDVAIMAIPFDGRWQNGIDFLANRVMDGRKRPGNVERLGFDMWEKHEVEYQLENARELGLQGERDLTTEFLPQAMRDCDFVYLGLGYKRDQGGFGSSKHFGDRRYGLLVSEIRKIRPHTHFISSGGVADMFAFANVTREIGTAYSDYYGFFQGGLRRTFDMMPACWAYIGNDTGAMHIAASTNMPTFGLFRYPELTVKNPPFCDHRECLVFDDSTDPADVARQFVEFAWEEHSR